MHGANVKIIRQKFASTKTSILLRKETKFIHITDNTMMLCY